MGPFASLPSSYRAPLACSPTRWMLAQWLQDHHFGDFPGGPVVKNPHSNAGDMGSIPGQGTKIPHAVEQLSPSVVTREVRMRQILILRSLEPKTREAACCRPRTAKK